MRTVKKKPLTHPKKEKFHWRNADQPPIDTSIRMRINDLNVLL
jgi:hypothetical protein